MRKALSQLLGKKAEAHEIARVDRRARLHLDGHDLPCAVLQDKVDLAPRRRAEVVDA